LEEEYGVGLQAAEERGQEAVARLRAEVREMAEKAFAVMRYGGEEGGDE
jgi:hypothetical protein